MRYILNRVLGCMLALTTLVMLNSCSDQIDGHDRFLLIFADSVEITYDEEWEAKSYYDDFLGVTTIPLYLAGDNLELDYLYTVDLDYEINTDYWEWSSSDESVAMVDSNGTVYPIGVGSAYITISVKSSDPGSTQHNASILVVVSNKLISAAAVTVEPEDGETYLAYEGGFTIQLVANVSQTASDPVFGSDVTYNTFTWYSSNPDVADIDASTGLVTTASLPGTLESLAVTFFAVAVDDSGVEGSVDIDILEAIPPTWLEFNDDAAPFDGRKFARNENGFSFSYSKEPEISTKELIEWTVSDESAVQLVDDGKNIAATFVGTSLNDITLKGTCVATGISDEITFSLPAGYIRERYESSSSDDWDFGISTGHQSSGATQTWMDGCFLSCLTYDAAGSGSGGRADIACYNMSEIGFNSNYPIFAIRLLDILSYEYVSYRGLQFKFSLQLDGQGDVYAYTGGYNTYSYYYELSDGTQVVVWDFSSSSYFGDQSYYPSGNSELVPSSFQLVQSTVTLETGNYVGDGIVVFPYQWQMHSVETFTSLDDLETHLTDDLGVTYKSTTL